MKGHHVPQSPRASRRHIAADPTAVPGRTHTPDLSSGWDPAGTTAASPVCTMVHQGRACTARRRAPACEHPGRAAPAHGGSGCCVQRPGAAGKGPCPGGRHTRYRLREASAAHAQTIPHTSANARPDRHPDRTAHADAPRPTPPTTATPTPTPTATPTPTPTATPTPTPDAHAHGHADPATPTATPTATATPRPRRPPRPRPRHGHAHGHAHGHPETPTTHRHAHGHPDPTPRPRPPRPPTPTATPTATPTPTPRPRPPRRPRPRPRPPRRPRQRPGRRLSLLRTYRLGWTSAGFRTSCRSKPLVMPG